MVIMPMIFPRCTTFTLAFAKHFSFEVMGMNCL